MTTHRIISPDGPRIWPSKPCSGCGQPFSMSVESIRESKAWIEAGAEAVYKCHHCGTETKFVIGEAGPNEVSVMIK